MKYFTDWHSRAALAHGLLLSRRGDEDDARHRLADLHREVELVYKDFQKTVAGEPPHGRISDVDMTFRRLLQSLKTID